MALQLQTLEWILSFVRDICSESIRDGNSEDSFTTEQQTFLNNILRSYFSLEFSVALCYLNTPHANTGHPHSSALLQRELWSVCPSDPPWYWIHFITHRCQVCSGGHVSHGWERTRSPAIITHRGNRRCSILGKSACRRGDETVWPLEGVWVSLAVQLSQLDALWVDHKGFHVPFLASILYRGENKNWMINVALHGICSS